MSQANSIERAGVRPLTSGHAAELGTGALAILLMACCAALAIYQLRPPAPNPANAPAAEFSSGRALAHLAVIASQSHPLGSPAHTQVRDEIMRELTALGLSPQLQTTPAISNILVRQQGSAGGGRAILLAAHYDTVPDSPGASDDGSGVVVLLETLRALRAGAPLRNDLICLFSDGEEAGLQGAKAFAYAHPWAKDVGLVLNFEARGNHGPAVMFETSEENGWLIAQLAEAAPHAVANSLAGDIYKRMPNKTDLTIFKEAGLAGLNFAYLDGINHYHSPLDTLAAIDERSLQHQGAYALALTRRLGDADLADTRRPDAVYFSLLGVTLVHYAQRLVIPLTIVALLLLVGVVLLGLRRRRLTFAGIGQGFAATLLTVGATVLGVTVAWWLTGPLLGRKIARGAADYNSALDMLILSVCAVLVASLCYVWLARRISGWHLLTGGLLWWLVLTVLTSLFLPGGSFLFVWPLLSGLLALALGLVVPRQQPVATKHLAVLAVCVLPGTLLFAPVIYLTLIAFTLRSVTALPVLALPAALLLVLLTPQLALLTAARKKLFT